MKKTVAVLMAILLIVPTVASANPFTRFFANRLTNQVMRMLEPRIAEIVDRAPVSAVVKSDMRRQLNDAARRIVDQEIQSAMGGKMPKPAAIVNKAVGELNTIAQNIIRGGAGGALAGASGGVSGTMQAAPRVKPRLKIEPFTLWGYTDDDMETIVAILAAQDSLQMAYNIVNNEAEYILVTEMRTIVTTNVLVMRILNVNDSSQVTSTTLNFRTAEEIVEQLPQVAGRIAVATFAALPSLPSSVMLGGVTDSRDGKTYRIVEMPDGKIWMAENLNFRTDNSWCYADNTSNCNVYGRLYDWNTAQTVCPAGWRLPHDVDWTALENAIGGSATAGQKLKSQGGWQNNGNGTNEFGFSALPGGIRWAGGFNNVGLSGNWWSATESNATDAWYRVIYSNNENVSRGTGGKTFGFSVRCIME